jgi:23S rRNA pseudouridine1911/1915/1917 synthase
MYCTITLTTQAKSLEAHKVDIPILYEDADCVAFNKPAGLLVIPTDTGKELHTLVSLVNQQFPNTALHPAHRLDRDTSGVILFAKGKTNQQTLMQSFKDKKVTKNYIAFVHGKLSPPKGKINFPIKDYYQHKFQKHMPAQSAVTHYEVEKYFKEFTVVNVMPITGRTNQIRIHFSKLKHPLVGEDKYAFRKDFPLKFKRTALHAWRLQWPHPKTGKILVVQAPLPKDMADFLDKHQ